MTGVTGTLGSWLAASALEMGMGVCAVARSARDGSASQRVESSLAMFGAIPRQRLRIVEGDVTAAATWEDESRIPRDIDLVVHCAACTEFADAAAELSHRTNVQGVERMLAFAARRRLPVVHISTAYVAGQRQGVVFEHELDAGQSFNNAYERTKCAGEALVRRWARETGLPATILRPSIVLGDFECGRTRTFNTLYDVIQALDSLGGAAAGEELRIIGDAAITKNFISIDFFADAAWYIIRNGAPRTYHIVNPRPLTLGALQRIFADLFDVRATLVSEAEFASVRASRAERICNRAIRSYRPYMTGPEPTFDRSALDAVLAGSGIVAPELHTDYFRRLLAYARSVNWGRARCAAEDAEGGIASVADYFDAFLAGKVGEHLLPDVRRLSARIGVGFHGTDAHWSMDVQDGTLRAVSSNGMITDCRYLLDVPTFMDIVGGRLNPQQAFFARRVEITGDVEMGLRVAAVLAQFFRRHPFDSGTDLT